MAPKTKRLAPAATASGKTEIFTMNTAANENVEDHNTVPPTEDKVPKGAYHPRKTDTILPGLTFVHSTEPTRNRHIYKIMQHWSPKGDDDVKPRKGLAGYMVRVSETELKRVIKCTSIGCEKCGRQPRVAREGGAGD